jgi:uncharacterized protein (TIGR02996 family)
MNDADFLATIRANPQDAASRIVYADWLEERGDPRAELIRTEEEMRQLPVFADRYWQLKPRWEELCTLAAVDWREALGYGDWRPVFRHGIPEGLRERWRLIRVFTEVWNHRPSLGDVGRRTAAIQAEEARLGRTLSPSLREWVAYAYDVSGASDAHQVLLVLRDNYQLTELQGHDAVSLLLRGEGDYHWAVRHEHLNLNDPPVYGYGWDGGHVSADDDAYTFTLDPRSPLAPGVTAFTLDYALSYAHGAGGEFWVEVYDRGRVLDDLAAALPTHVRLGEADIFEADNLLVWLPPWWQENRGHRLRVLVARPVPRETLPAFLLECADHGYNRRGMFSSPDRENPPLLEYLKDPAVGEIPF